MDIFLSRWSFIAHEILLQLYNRYQRLYSTSQFVYSHSLETAKMRSTRILFGAFKQVAINSKRGNKNFYKGRGAPSIGKKLNNGRFRVEQEKLDKHIFIAPDLTGFKVC